MSLSVHLLFLLILDISLPFFLFFGFILPVVTRSAV